MHISKPNTFLNNLHAIVLSLFYRTQILRIRVQEFVFNNSSYSY